MCLKMNLCSETPAAQAWCIAAMETAFGPSYRVSAGTDCMPPLDTPLVQNGIAMIVIEQVSGFAPEDIRQLIKWCHARDKALLVCGALSEEERESYGLSHCIEINITALHAPVCIQWISCAGTLHLFEEMFVPTLKTAQRTAHLYCSGIRCQHHRSRAVTSTLLKQRTPLKGPERRKSPIGHSHANAFPREHCRQPHATEGRRYGISQLP